MRASITCYQYYLKIEMEKSSIFAQLGHEKNVSKWINLQLNECMKK